MKIICLLFFLLIGCEEKIIFTPNIEKITTQMSENVLEERGLCLKYIRVGNAMVIYDYKIPKTIKTTYHGVLSYPCSKTFQISWHSHGALSIINPKVKEYFRETTGIELRSPEQMVYLSKGDIRYAKMYKPQYMMVQVDRNNYALWHLRQLKNQDILLPDENTEK